MKDFSFWTEYEGASEGSGRSEKIWLMNPDTEQVGLFKFKKDVATTDHVSECIACDLAQLLNIPCAKFELGTYKGREGSMSYNIVDRRGMVLIEGIYCISTIYRSFDADRLIDVETGDRYSIEKVSQYLGKDRLMWKSLIETKSRSIIRISCKDQKQPTHLEVLRYLKDNYYLQTKDFAKMTVTTVTETAVCDILNKYGEILSPKRQELIKRYLLSKVQLLETVYKEGEDVS